MNFLNKLHSITSRLHIELQRYVDHSWRKFTGLPALSKSEITSQLYLGGQYSHRGYKILNKRGITSIVNMRISKTIPYELDRPIPILHLPTEDLHAPTISQLKKGIQFIKKEIDDGGKVYVHCRAGEGRGPTMVIAYLMSTGMLFEDAYALIKKIRPFIRVTPPQKRILKQLENELNQLHKPLQILRSS